MMYLAQCSDFSPLFFARMLPLLPMEKLTAIQRIKHDLTRKQSVLGWAMLQKIRFQRGCSLDAPLQFSEHGKPYYPGESLQFSISHSGDFVCLAVSDTPVGVDLQIMSHPSAGVKKRVLCDRELEALALSADESAAFTTLWACKESYLKYRGTGISEPMRPLDFSPALSQTRFSLYEVSFQLWVTDAYVLSVCGKSQLEDEIVWMFPADFDQILQHAEL